MGLGKESYEYEKDWIMTVIEIMEKKVGLFLEACL